MAIPRGVPSGSQFDASANPSHAGTLGRRGHKTKLRFLARLFQTDSAKRLPINRITKTGKFDWGSFSAFEDGSIEVEIAGVKQWFQNFSELERGLRSRGRGRRASTHRSRVSASVTTPRD